MRNVCLTEIGEGHFDEAFVDIGRRRDTHCALGVQSRLLSEIALRSIVLQCEKGFIQPY